ncbi:GAF domain-containing protein [Leptothermofonsia sp. ETS-13]|uniref:GAF domain-containing protein n=1 Tax=Leptothermofonsia sp. ETS-13 TaxID=3035696 RepID=UPI003B9E0454
MSSSISSLIHTIGESPLIPAMRHNEDFTNLWHQILQITLAHTDFNLILGELAASLGEAFQVDGCILAFPNAQVACWHSGNFQLIPRLQAAEMAFKNLSTQSVVIIPDVATPPKDSADELAWKFDQIWQATLQVKQASLPAKALLGATIQFQGETNGLISLMKSLPYLWTEAEIEGLQMVSQPIAIALSQLQLQQQLNKQVKYQAVVNQLTMAIRNSSNLPEILQLATEGTAKVLQAKRGMLLQLKYSDPLFKSRFQEHLPKIRATVVCEWLGEPDPNQRACIPASALHQSFWVAECALCQHVVNHSSGPISATDRQHLPKLDNHSGIAPIFNLEELPALLLSPLESQGTILGFLVFQHSYPYVWQPEEIELVELVSAQVSTAIIQTETLRQVQALVEKRTAELQQSLSVQAKLYERTRQQLEQLRRLNQLKDEFLSTVSHELRTPPDQHDNGDPNAAPGRTFQRSQCPLSRHSGAAMCPGNQPD